MDLSSGTLRLSFERDNWDSLILFEDGIPVALGGTLELTFASAADAEGQLGRTIRIFDWTGVTPFGQFTVVSPYTWDLSNLYTTGTITLIPESSTAVNLLVALALVQAFGKLRRRSGIRV